MAFDAEPPRDFLDLLDALREDSNSNVSAGNHAR
jgi:hypothetical protein